MKLLSFRVAGFRSLEDVAEIPVREPTVLTGANDGGKTASLDALGYLLGDYPIASPDPTTVGAPPEDGSADVETVPTTAVTGTFALSDDDRDELGFGDDRIQIRRTRNHEDGTDEYHVLATVPEDPRLQGLQAANVNELKERAQDLGLEPEGDLRKRDPWLEALQGVAETTDKIQAWVDAPRDLVANLPRYVRFSSTREPDLQNEIYQALKGAFDRLMDDASIVGPVKETERAVQDRLEEEARDLCAHIKARCPELVDITVQPSVSFREGFRQVEVRSGTRPGFHVPVQYSGAGRRRRMTLAVWEWTRDLVAETADRQVVIAYDEPDTHLDYTRQRELVELIRNQAANENVRILVATHSLNLIDKVEIADVVHLQLDEGRTRVSRLLTDEHDEVDRYLATISAAMGLRNSVLLHERLFVGVEGSTESQALPILFRTATGISLQSAGIALIAGNGNRGAREVARWLSDHNRQVEFIIDKDSSTDQSTRHIFTKEKLQAVGIDEDQMHLLGDPNELEDLFSDEQWAATANEKWPRNDGREWSPEDFVSLRAHKFSKELLEMVRVNSDEGPSTKPECMVTLAGRLDDPDEIPDQLRDVFEHLMEQAGGIA